MRNFKTQTEISISQVKKFVYKAKKETFAGTDIKVSMTNQSSILSYRAFNSSEYAGMIYNDEYSGNTVEAGQETVSMDLCNVWRNQYYGGSFLQYWDGKRVKELEISSCVQIEYLPFITIEFLKKALLRLPPEFPVRGPHYFHANRVDFDGESYYGNWEYENNWKKISVYSVEDPFVAFQGEEVIRCNGIAVYWHGYHGGFLRDKYFPIILR